MTILPGQVESFEGGLVVAAVPLVEALTVVQPCTHTSTDDHGVEQHVVQDGQYTHTDTVA